MVLHEHGAFCEKIDQDPFARLLSLIQEKEESKSSRYLEHYQHVQSTNKLPPHMISRPSLLKSRPYPISYDNRQFLHYRGPSPVNAVKNRPPPPIHQQLLENNWNFYHPHVSSPYQFSFSTSQGLQKGYPQDIFYVVRTPSFKQQPYFNHLVHGYPESSQTDQVNKFPFKIELPAEGKYKKYHI